MITVFFILLLGLVVCGFIGWCDYRLYKVGSLPELTDFEQHYGSLMNGEYPGEMIKLDSCQIIYAVGFWGQLGLTMYYFTGEYNNRREPLVWYFNDHNGFYETWSAVPIQATTSGCILTWSFDKEKMEQALQILQQQEKDRI